MSKKQIQIAVDTKDHMPIDMLEPFQGQLKSLSEVDYKKLKKEIVETGFAFAVHVWMSPDNHCYIIDGHQRIRTIKNMIEEEDFTIGDIPIVIVKAKSFEEAKRRIMQGVSQYGRIEADGLYEFLTESQINPDWIQDNFRIPDVDSTTFLQAYFKEQEKDYEGSKELEMSEFDKFNHTCPRCKFEFNDG